MIDQYGESSRKECKSVSSFTPSSLTTRARGAMKQVILCAQHSPLNPSDLIYIYMCPRDMAVFVFDFKSPYAYYHIQALFPSQPSLWDFPSIRLHTWLRLALLARYRGMEEGVNRQVQKTGTLPFAPLSQGISYDFAQSLPQPMLKLTLRCIIVATALHTLRLPSPGVL
jgi:hypothetical protein